MLLCLPYDSIYFSCSWCLTQQAHPYIHSSAPAKTRTTMTDYKSDDSLSCLLADDVQAKVQDVLSIRKEYTIHSNMQ